jgi:NAD(P)-dependent dehydrogenase (short-subunit alcohol dehydrogenase family)
MGTTKELNCETTSPIGNAARTVFYDDRGEPYGTEWQLVETGKRLSANGFVAAVAGIRRHGCGEAIAGALAAQGYAVVAGDRDNDAGQEAADRIRRHGGEIWFRQADMSTPEGVDGFMEETARRGGRLDILVCNVGNAGDPRRDNILDVTPDRIHLLLSDNLVAPLLLTREAVRRFMVPQRSGTVIYIGSNNGQRGMGIRGQLIYGAAKTALTSVVAACAAQLGKMIRFNLIRPGVVETDSENWRCRKRENPLWAGVEAQAVAAGALVRPTDVANAVVWLASDEAKYVQGAELSVDGGEAATGVMFPAWDPADFRASYVASVGILEGATSWKAG